MELHTCIHMRGGGRQVKNLAFLPAWDTWETGSKNSNDHIVNWGTLSLIIFYLYLYILVYFLLPTAFPFCWFGIYIMCSYWVLWKFYYIHITEEKNLKLCLQYFNPSLNKTSVLTGLGHTYLSALIYMQLSNDLVLVLF